MLIKVNKYPQKITNINKVFWPEEKIVKGDLIQYYLQVSPYLLPHLKNRPMVMKRYPDGIKGKFFYQKQCPDFAPPWLKTVTIEDRKMILVNDLDSLIWLINLGCIELHPWLSTVNHLTKPDIIVFDLDPEPPAGFQEALRVALLIREFLDVAQLQSYPKTSGSEGLHIYIPVKPLFSFEVIRRTLQKICLYFVQKYPNLITTELVKNRRKGKVYLDFLQNGYGKTMASVYSIRPVRGALVSTPLTWSEVRQGIDKNKFTIYSLKKRLEELGDIFAPVNSQSQDFSPLVNMFVDNLV